MQSNQNAKDEILLKDLGDMITRLFYGFINTIYKVFKFYWKFKFIIIALVAIGVALHLVKSNLSTPSYQNTALVIQNFESVDYLYNTVENIENNLGAEVGESYLKEVFGENFKKVNSIEIEAIDNFYNFDDVNSYNRSDFEILASSSDVSNNIKQYKETNYFKYHRINFIIKDTLYAKNIIDHFFSYMNSNDHFNDYAKAYTTSIKKSLAENEQSIVSIDSLLGSYIINNEKTNASVSVSNNSELYQLYEKKEKLRNQNLHLQTKMVDFSKVIKPVAVEYNAPQEQILPKVLVYPFLLVILFSLVYLFRYLLSRAKAYQ